MQHTFADGKYTDWMLVDYDKMKEERDELLDFVQEWITRQGTDGNYMTSRAKELIAKATNDVV